MNTILKYPGSKWAIADWIIRFFPDHHSYLEPFFGSGAVLFKKPRSNIETVNDLDNEVINLFDCIRKDPERLARELYWTPYSREVYEQAYINKSDEAFTKAKLFYIRCNMGHGFRTTGEKVGWKNDVHGRERAYASRDWCNLPERIMKASERLRGVQIENKPAIELISRFNNSKVLIYCDPPYMFETRHGKQYMCEMSDIDHKNLLDVLLNHKGPVIISGYETKLYNDVLKGWHKENTVSYSQVCSKKIEKVWMNFKPSGQLTIW